MGNFVYKQSLGQNFIYDLGFLRSITDKLDIKRTDRIIEVGTGAGTLTTVLSGYGCEVTTVEIDERLKPILEKQFAGIPNITVRWGDVQGMKFDGIFRVVANVPYYITTPIIFQFLSNENCTDINILVAEDVAKRIAAEPSTPEYGALSVACQVYAKCSLIKRVPRGMFTPCPKIDSAFVRIAKTDAPAVDGRAFSNLLKRLFAARRKTILNGLLSMGRAKDEILRVLADCGIAPTVRAETLPPTKFVELCQKLTNQNK